MVKDKVDIIDILYLSTHQHNTLIPPKHQWYIDLKHAHYKQRSFYCLCTTKVIQFVNRAITQPSFQAKSEMLTVCCIAIFL